MSSIMSRPNQPPVADDDALSATASEDGSWTFSANDLLGNDYDPDVDDVFGTDKPCLTCWKHHG